MENREQMQLEEMLLKYKMASKVLYTGLDNLIDEYKYRTQTNPVYGWSKNCMYFSR